MSTLAELRLMLPEIVLLAGACLVLITPVRMAWLLTLLALAGAVVALFATSTADTVLLLSGSYERSGALDILRVTICALVYLTLQYARGCIPAGPRMRSGEFYALALFGCLGMFLLCGAAHLIVLYLGVEILALSLYPMIALARDDGRSAEAAIKYFVLGALASGFLLYGISLLYAATGTLGIDEMAAQIAVAPPQSILLLGLVFTLAGVAFKLGAAPFHMWLPDVYDAAPLPAISYLSAAPKIAGLVLVLRMFPEALASLADDWSVLMGILAVLSLAVGNLLAIVQTRIRRMLGYSAIAHAGFVFLGLSTGTIDGTSAAVLYTLLYALMAAGIFGMVLLFNHKQEMEDISDFRGLGERHPWFAFLTMILMLSLAGIPLTAGFTAKLTVLQAVIGAGMWPLAAVAVLLTVIGAYYYLRIIWYMYFEQTDAEPVPSECGQTRVLVSLNSLILVVIFVFPQGLIITSHAVAARIANL